MPATAQKISEFLESREWSDAEKWVIKWQFGLHGDFEQALANLIRLADDSNLHRLALSFPVEVSGLYLWRDGDLGERLRAAGLGI